MWHSHNSRQHNARRRPCRAGPSPPFTAACECAGQLAPDGQWPDIWLQRRFVARQAPAPLDPRSGASRACHLTSTLVTVRGTISKCLLAQVCLLRDTRRLWYPCLALAIARFIELCGHCWDGRLSPYEKASCNGYLVRGESSRVQLRGHGCNDNSTRKSSGYLYACPHR